MLNPVADAKAESVAPVRVLLIDDHPHMSEPVLQTLPAAGFTLIGHLLDADSALAQVNSLEPDVILLDVSLGPVCGIDIVRDLRQRASNAKVLLLSVFEDEEFIDAGLAAGAMGYVFKSHIATDLVQAINDAKADRVFTSGPCAYPSEKSSSPNSCSATSEKRP